MNLQLQFMYMITVLLIIMHCCVFNLIMNYNMCLIIFYSNPFINEIHCLTLNSLDYSQRTHTFWPITEYHKIVKCVN